MLIFVQRAPHAKNRVKLKTHKTMKQCLDGEKFSYQHVASMRAIVRKKFQVLPED